MRQAVWTGSINFGLVSIPIRLYPATEPKDVRFHLYDRRSGKRVRYERVVRDDEPATFTDEPSASEPSRSYDTPARRADDERPRTPSDVHYPVNDGAVSDDPVDDDRLEEDRDAWTDRGVSADDIVRGVELPGGDFVTVTDDELDALAPERSRTIDIEEFVDLADIDPVFFEKSYYVAPAWNTGADKPYVLLLRAMQAAKMVGIGRFVLRTKPHLVAIRPIEGGLALETLFFGDEVRSVGEVARLPEIAVSDRELKMAQQLIGAMATDWIPSKHADLYREELLELLRAKPATQRAEESPTAVSPIGDLMAKLKASVEAAKSRADTARKPGAKRVS